MGGQRHAPAALPLGKNRYPLHRRLGGPQNRSGQMRKIFTHTGIRSPDRPARSESLYRLRYPGSRVRKRGFRLVTKETCSIRRPLAGRWCSDRDRCFWQDLYIFQRPCTSNAFSWVKKCEYGISTHICVAYSIPSTIRCTLHPFHFLWYSPRHTLTRNLKSNQ
jgi:hypothetical protein